MYFTHYFANHAALDRVRSWLLALGFPPSSVEAHADGIPRLTVAVEASWLPGIQMLIDAVERTDPHGWPGLWDVAHQAHVYPEAGKPATAPDSVASRSTAVGWHPFDAAAEVDPVSLAMSRRWGRA